MAPISTTLSDPEGHFSCLKTFRIPQLGKCDIMILPSKAYISLGPMWPVSLKDFWKHSAIAYTVKVLISWRRCYYRPLGSDIGLWNSAIFLMTLNDLQGHLPIQAFSNAIFFVKLCRTWQFVPDRERRAVPPQQPSLFSLYELALTFYGGHNAQPDRPRRNKMTSVKITIITWDENDAFSNEDAILNSKRTVFSVVVYWDSANLFWVQIHCTIILFVCHL